MLRAAYGFEEKKRRESLKDDGRSGGLTYENVEKV